MASDFRLFKGKGKRETGAATLPPHVRDHQWDDPGEYVAEEGLVRAVNVAIALARPLLVTGDPGTGKTQLARRIAYELTPESPEPPRFQTKTRSDSTDLFYRYDALRHFQDVQTKKQDIEIRNYIRIEAFGIAILRAEARRGLANSYLPEQYRSDAPRRTVVLIDEIDKAPRDLPNDVLAEIEDFKFEIKETGERFEAVDSCRPLVILTSNSERDLPDAFLRRCVYYHIPFPERDVLRDIVARRVPSSSQFTPERWKSTFDRFFQVHGIATKKKPGTDELIAWVRILDRLGIDAGAPGALADDLRSSFSILVKDKHDLANARNLV